MRNTRLPFVLIFFLFVLFATPARAVIVSNVTELVNAINDANAGGDKTILCMDGTYVLNSILYVTADSVTVRSLSGNRDSVIIMGQGMAGGVSHVFLVPASDFSVCDLTLGWVANHGIQIQGEQDADRPLIQNVRIVDTYEQMVKVSAGGSAFSDSGIVENCLFEYGAGVGPQWYIGGVDAHRSRNWIVRNNVFKNIQSPGGAMAEHAIHFWNNSENTLVECNLIISCDRAVGFGLGSSPHTGGIIRNNMIYHDTTGSFSDVGIGLETAPDVQVYNNTIYHEHGYPNAIEYRFAATTNVFIANNLTNKDIVSRDGGTGTDTCNIENALPGWFVDMSAADLHLGYEVLQVVDQGIPIAGLDSDFDGDVRPQGLGIDIGADEYISGGIFHESIINEKQKTPVCQVYPNPFNGKAKIIISACVFNNTPAARVINKIVLEIRDAGGKMVRTFSLNPSHSGSREVIWDGTGNNGESLPSGVYFIQLTDQRFSAVEKIVLLGK